MSHTHGSDGYNGWKNHSTWHVSLILGNGQETQSMMRDIVRGAYGRGMAEAIRDEYAIYGKAEDRARHALYVAGEALKEYCDTLLETYCDISSLRLPYRDPVARAEAEAIRMIAAQCINSYMAECDFVEIAASIMAAIAEERAYNASQASAR